MEWRQLVVLVILLQGVFAQWSRPTSATGERQCDSGQDCMLLKDCASLSGLAQRDKRPAVVMQLQQAHCGFQGAHPKVCCPSGTTGAATLAPAASGPASPPPPLSAEATANLRLLPVDECGPLVEDRIIGGKEAAIAELPWMARLGYRNEFSPELEYNCGGSLISDRYVLTAAHCINENSGLIPVSVRLGELDASSTTDCSFVSGVKVCAPPVLDVVVEKIIKHKKYGENRLQNDIALLRLAKTVPFSEFVRPVCLPIESKEQRLDLTGKKVQVAGWGRVANRNGAGGSKTLMKVKVTVTRNAECAAAYQPLQHPISTEKQLCAAEPGKDSCNGDSGGPLTTVGTINNIPRVVQHGVVSFGPSQCATEGVPGVYTKVGHYVSWIVGNLEA